MTEGLLKVKSCLEAAAAVGQLWLPACPMVSAETKMRLLE